MFHVEQRIGESLKTIVGGKSIVLSGRWADDWGVFCAHEEEAS
jgi:hypothetical protein